MRAAIVSASVGMQIHRILGGGAGEMNKEDTLESSSACLPQQLPQIVSDRSAPVIQLQPLALTPQAAAQFLSISKRSLSRLIAAGKTSPVRKVRARWSMLIIKGLLRRLASQAIKRADRAQRKRPRGFPQGR
jgi:hypothetical protein